jgi:hypothetical protein
LKPKREERARFGVGFIEYVEARLPVRGVSVRVIVYGKEEAVVIEGVLAAMLERAAEVPARGFERVVAEEVVADAVATPGGRVVKRRPVLRPITELRGL